MAGGAALEFDPRDVVTLAGALEFITGDEALRRELAAAGPRRAAAFSWRATAEKTLAALEDAAGFSRSRARFSPGAS
jgi:alpha-1,3-rhamnosyl/mannosyltransferase